MELENTIYVQNYYFVFSRLIYDLSYVNLTICLKWYKEVMQIVLGLVFVELFVKNVDIVASYL